MEVSIRVLTSPQVNRHLSHTILTRHYSLRISANHSPPPLSNLSPIPAKPFSGFPLSPLTPRPRSPQSDGSKPNFKIQSRSVQLPSSAIAFSGSSIPSPNSNPLGFLLSLSVSSFLNSSPSHEENFNFRVSDASERFPAQSRNCSSGSGGELGFRGDKGPVLTVVLLGWLGAEQKHLKRYTELYNSRGIRSVSFVVPVKELLGFDLGRRVEKRIEDLADELLSWLSEKEKDGRDRGLIFHTFSNTGWLAYGAILDYFRQRGDYYDNIKGCVIDSGADPQLNPQVWAAGFAAALLKKRSSLTSAGDAFNGDNSKLQDQYEKLPLIETLFLLMLEKFFTGILSLPDVKRRLNKIISILSSDQPPCPQLYLYSTADKVIPVHSVESFIQGQKKAGRKVWAHNFDSSPHVDHLRTFPYIYSEQVHKFLKECIPMVGQI